MAVSSSQNIGEAGGYIIVRTIQEERPSVKPKPNPNP